MSRCVKIISSLWACLGAGKSVIKSIGTAQDIFEEFNKLKIRDDKMVLSPEQKKEIIKTVAQKLLDKHVMSLEQIVGEVFDDIEFELLKKMNVGV